MASNEHAKMLTGIYRVDSIKKAARKEAWYRQDSDEVKTFNIFGRVNTRPQRKRDVETGLYKTQTENDARTPTEDLRKKSYEREREGFEGPHKAGTYPVGPGGNGNMPSSREDNEISSGYDESKPSTEKQTPNDVDARRSSGSEANNGNEGTRRRKGLKFWKKEEKTADEKSNKQRRRDKFGPPPTVMSQVKAVFLSWINLLLVFVPVGFALEYAHINKIVVFVINFLAIIPLAAMLSFATEELAMYIGETLGGLLNATFGNAVELIVSVIALTQGKILIVQTSLIGSMLSNLLLVLGMCFFFGGINRVEQFFNVTVAQTAASLLALAIGSLIIPTAFRIFANDDQGVTPTSRGTSVLLLVTYAAYLIFQLRTHVEMYNEPSQKAPKKKDSGKKEAGDASRGIAAIGASTGAAVTGGEELQDEEEEETPQLSIIGSLVTLGGSTVSLPSKYAEEMEIADIFPGPDRVLRRIHGQRHRSSLQGRLARVHRSHPPTNRWQRSRARYSRHSVRPIHSLKTTKKLSTNTTHTAPSKTNSTSPSAWPSAAPCKSPSSSCPSWSCSPGSASATAKAPCP